MLFWGGDEATNSSSDAWSPDDDPRPQDAQHFPEAGGPCAGLELAHPVLAHEVGRVLRDGILDFHLAPGRVLEAELLAWELRVPAAEVHQALADLISAGLVEHAPTSCPNVLLPSRLQVQDLLDVRVEVEEITTREFVRRASGAQVGALRRAAERFEAEARGPRPRPALLLHAREQVSCMLFRGGGSAAALSVIADLAGPIKLVLAAHLSTSTAREQAARDLLAVAGAAAAGDPDGAAAACSSHLWNSITGGFAVLDAWGWLRP